PLVPCATAQVAGEGLTDLCFGGPLVVLEEVCGGHDHARYAEPALDCPLLDERALQRAELSLPRQAFDGRDLPSVRFHGQDEAGVHCLSVHPDGAGATLAFRATLLRPDQIEVVAEDVEQRVVGGCVEDVTLPV